MEKPDGTLEGAERMGDEGASMGGGHSLGQTGGPRGVEDVGDLVGADLDLEGAWVPVDEFAPVALARPCRAGTDDKEPGVPNR